MLRASATIRQWPGTTLPAVPPSILPTFAVVPSSSRPSFHAGDRRRGRRDRVAAGLGVDPRVRLDSGELGDDLLLGRRARDHLADGARVVEDEAAVGAECRRVDRLRPPQPLLLGDGQQQLDPDRRRLRGVAGGELDEDRDSRLVVGAEDRLAAAAKDAVGLHDLDLPRMRDGVDVGTEHRPGVTTPRQPGEDVARPRLCRAGGVVLADLEPHRPQLGDQRVGDLALLAGDAADLAEPDEPLVQPLHAGQANGLPRNPPGRGRPLRPAWRRRGGRSRRRTRGTAARAGSAAS